MVSPMVMPSTPATGDDVADFGLGNVDALEAGEAEELGDAGLLERAVELGDGDVVAGVQGSLEDAGDGEAAEVVGVVEVGDLDLQDAVGIALAGGDGVDDRLEERHRGPSPGRAGIEAGLAELGVGVEDGEVELIFVWRRDR